MCTQQLSIRSLPLLFLRFSSMHVSLFPLPCSSKRPRKQDVHAITTVFTYPYFSDTVLSGSPQVHPAPTEDRQFRPSDTPPSSAQLSSRQ
ncbi:hypothetical protein C8J56DRAFT_959773 [Mycena floridula]|nr:hypothetical protein C8J56DRAFT_959773 [Mycena floridula]